MGRRNGFPPGAFSWIELVTADPAVATEFYERLFGWSGNGDGVFRLGGDAVAGLIEGPPTGWTNAITVADAAAGEQITDSQGAVLALRGPSAMSAQRVNEPGSLCMNELITPDLDAARAYYERRFGWTTEPFGTGMALVFNDGAVNASMIAVPGSRAHWRPCFAVASINDATARVRDLGGTILTEPLDIPDGALAVAADPHGSPFSLFAGDLDP